MSTKKSKLVVICGPTATGKSRLAVDIAHRFNGEVINADSMQVYCGMDIASAMPSEEEKRGIPHHLFGIIEPSQPFSVAEWLTLARSKIAELTQRSVLPVVVGGTGLYISSLVDNIIFDEIRGDSDFRAKMYSLAGTRGNAYLLEKLREVDPEAAAQLHENNVKRVIRALETHKMSGKQSQERLKSSKIRCSPYDGCMLGIDFEDRQELYARINRRVDDMISCGLIQEAEQAIAGSDSGCAAAYDLSYDSPTSAQAIGHKELAPYIMGESDLESCVELLKQKTRNYAKRQLTWFRKDVRVNWLRMNKMVRHIHVFEKSVRILGDFVE